MRYSVFCDFFFQAEDGIRDLVRSRGLGDVYKRQVCAVLPRRTRADAGPQARLRPRRPAEPWQGDPYPCLLYTSDAADERSSVDLGGRRIIKKKNKTAQLSERSATANKT